MDIIERLTGELRGGFGYPVTKDAELGEAFIHYLEGMGDHSESGSDYYASLIISLMEKGKGDWEIVKVVNRLSDILDLMVNEIENVRSYLDNAIKIAANPKRSVWLVDGESFAIPIWK